MKTALSTEDWEGAQGIHVPLHAYQGLPVHAPFIIFKQVSTAYTRTLKMSDQFPSQVTR